jgi:hypothetical protein
MIKHSHNSFCIFPETETEYLVVKNVKGVNTTKDPHLSGMICDLKDDIPLVFVPYPNPNPYTQCLYLGVKQETRNHLYEKRNCYLGSCGGENGSKKGRRWLSREDGVMACILKGYVTLKDEKIVP